MEVETLTKPKYVGPRTIADRLHKTDEVTVMMFDDRNRMVYTYTANGFNNVTQAINTTYDSSESKNDIRDYTFRVTDRSTGTTALYRMNAHDHLHLIV